jgi:hypothetical protein
MCQQCCIGQSTHEMLGALLPGAAVQAKAKGTRDTVQKGFNCSCWIEVVLTHVSSGLAIHRRL